MFKDLLEQEGIACLLKNDRLSSAVGEIPFTDCFPELWVIDDEVYPRAHLLLNGWLTPDCNAGQDPWICSECGESCAPHFTVCWNCFRSRD